MLMAKLASSNNKDPVHFKCRIFCERQFVVENVNDILLQEINQEKTIF